MKNKIEAWALFKDYGNPLAIANTLDISPFPYVLFKSRRTAQEYEKLCTHKYEIVKVLITPLKSKKGAKV